MTTRRRIAIVIDARDPAIVDEAWRAAVGVSLRGAAVTVAVVDGSAAASERARATLALFGHAVDGDPAALAADVIELWRDDTARWIGAASDRATSIAHLVRVGRSPAAVAERDQVLQLGAPADVDYPAVLDAIAAADAACVW